MTNLNIDIYIQARMGSQRLPGKTLMRIGDTSILGLMIQRLKRLKGIRNIVVLTTENQIDNIIEEEAKKLDVLFFRGSENDLINRFSECQKKIKTDIIIRLTGDCPFIDPFVIESMLNIFIYNYKNIEFMTNCDQRSFARGQDVEIMLSSILDNINKTCTIPAHREHVVPYIEENKEKFKYLEYPNPSGRDDSKYRLTLDTIEDYTTLFSIFDKLDDKFFDYEELIKVVKLNPELIQNSNIEHKSYYQ